MHTLKWKFVQEMISDPLYVGALCPSSLVLATCMAKHVPITKNGLVVELGAGTGVVTAALLERGVDPERFIVTERSAVFVALLRRRFPALTVIQGDAVQLKAILPEGEAVAAIVSSLPLRSLPSSDTHRIVDQWSQVLIPGGIIVQFTYNLWQSGLPVGNKFAKYFTRIVWRNMPPARVVAASLNPQ